MVITSSTSPGKCKLREELFPGVQRLVSEVMRQECMVTEWAWKFGSGDQA